MLLVQFQSFPVTVTIVYKDDKLSMLIYLGIRHSVDQEKRLSALNQVFLNKSCFVQPALKNKRDLLKMHTALYLYATDGE